MRKHAIKRGKRVGVVMITALALTITGLSLTASANAQTGGVTLPGAAPPPAAPSNATLLPGGRVLAPAGAPPQVQLAINAANQIRKRRYVWGGGHASFFSAGYDCSGSVSYVLHAAGALESPLPSGPLMSWGEAGLGSWITVYSNPGHVFMVIAGVRFDTSSYGERVSRGRPGTGPRWRTALRPYKGFTARHIPGL